MPLILVGTRFQAVMALSVLAAHKTQEFDLVIFISRSSENPVSDVALRLLAERAASVTILNRTMQPLRLQLVLLKLATRQMFRDRVIMTALIGVLQVMMVFRLLGLLHCITFDEGGFNVSEDSPYRKPEHQSILKRLLFPNGVLKYAHYRTSIHYTAFDPALNVFSDKAWRINVDWTELLSFDDLNCLPDKTSSLFVLPCMRDLQLPHAQRAEIINHAATCDVAVCHPREHEIDLENAVSLKSPVEAVIAHLAKQRSVEVKHFRSTVGHTMSYWPNVKVIDIDSIDN